MADEAQIFDGGMAPTDGRPYLGNVETVDGIVRSFVATVSDLLAAGDGPGIVAALDAPAMIFAGLDPAYAPIPGWSTQPELGVYAATRLEFDSEQSLVDTMRTAFGLLAHGVIDTTKELASGSISEEDAQFRIDAVVEEMTAALTGTWEIVFPGDES